MDNRFSSRLLNIHLHSAKRRFFVALWNYTKSTDMFIYFIVICDFWLCLLKAAMSLMDPRTDWEFFF